MAPVAAPEEPPAVEIEAAAERAPRAALVRAIKRPKRSLLNRYAAAEAVEPAPEDMRRLPLAEVFARLAAGG